MSLYSFKVVLADGKTKEGRRTAKTEAAARQMLAKEMKIMDWVHIREVKQAGSAPKQPAPTPQKPAPTAPKSVSPIPVSNTKLGKMLYLQSGKCFFCTNELKELDASIEHLSPTSKGGVRREDNEVVCCKALNQTFGSMDLKRKFEFVLKEAGDFKCPMT